MFIEYFPNADVRTGYKILTYQLNTHIFHFCRPNNNGNGDKDDDADDDDDNDNETDENLAHRLGFRPINNETIRIIGRIRLLTSKQSFDRRDFENVEYLIDELIHLQHLENSSPQQLEKIIHCLKLYRVLHTKSHALQFIQNRLPQRTIRSNYETNANVFDIWRERERRARLDSKDSLEDEGQYLNGQQQSRDIIGQNYSNNSDNTSKVKQMAKHIDTRSASLCIGDYNRNVSPIFSNPNSDR